MEIKKIIEKLNLNKVKYDYIRDKVINEVDGYEIQLTRTFDIPHNPKCEYVISHGWLKRTIWCNIYDNELTPVRIKYPRYLIKNKNEGKARTFSKGNEICVSYSKISESLIKKILIQFKKINSTFTSVAFNCCVSDKTVERIFDRYINCPRGNLSKIICIDECHNKKQFGTEHPYCFVLSDFIKHEIIDVVKGRTKEVLKNYFINFSLIERLNVEVVIMDMWSPYRDIVKEFFPNAIISIDSFHVIQQLKFCIKRIEAQVLETLPEESKDRKFIKRWFNYIIDYKINHSKKSNEKSEKEKLSKFELKQKLRNISEKLYYCVKLLDEYKHFNATCSYNKFDLNFKSWTLNNPIFFDECFKDIYTMFTTCYVGIKNSFRKIVVNENNRKKRLSNGLAESINSIYKKIMSVSNGVRDFERFRKRLMYYFNKNINYLTHI